MKANISVVYIIYQMQVPSDFAQVLKSAMRQTIKPEIIVCEQNTDHTHWLKEFCIANGIKYVWEPELISNRGNMGMLKNIGIKLSTKKYIYFSDTDIIFLRDTYLETIVDHFEVSAQKILVRPPMLRLLEGKEEMFEFLDNNGEIVIDNCNRNCFVRFNGGNLRAAGGEHYRFYNNLPHVRYDDGTAWQLTYHSGGIAAETELVRKIGGYCTKYRGWGLDDIDLQWKLNETYGARSVLESIGALYVLHLEHPSRCNDEQYHSNRNEFDKRRRNGLDHSVRLDVREFEKLS